MENQYNNKLGKYLRKKNIYMHLSLIVIKFNIQIDFMAFFICSLFLYKRYSEIFFLQLSP